MREVPVGIGTLVLGKWMITEVRLPKASQCVSPETHQGDSGNCRQRAGGQGRATVGLRGSCVESNEKRERSQRTFDLECPDGDC